MMFIKKKGAVPERPGTRWSTALVWHLQGPSACSKHLDTPTQQWTTQCNQWVVILGPSHTSKRLSNQMSHIWNALALYRPVCLCEWLQWMGFRRNILENIYGLSYLIYLFFSNPVLNLLKRLWEVRIIFVLLPLGGKHRLSNTYPY